MLGGDWLLSISECIKRACEGDGEEREGEVIAKQS